MNSILKPAIALFLTTILVTGVNGESIVALNNTPTVSTTASRSYTGAATVADRTITGLPFNESGVTANKQGNVIAIADYDFFSNPDSARFKIDFRFSNYYDGLDDSFAAVSTQSSPYIRIENTSGMDLEYYFFSNLLMTAGTQEATLSHQMSDVTASATLFTTGFMNNRYLTTGQSLPVREHGDPGGGSRCRFRYNAYITGRNPLHNAYIGTATAEGTINLEFSPVSIPEPSTLSLIAIGLFTASGWMFLGHRRTA